MIQPPFKPGLYRHHKGDIYFAESLAWTSTNGRPEGWSVRYWSLATEKWCVREYDEFFDESVGEFGIWRFAFLPYELVKSVIDRAIRGAR